MHSHACTHTCSLHSQMHGACSHTWGIHVHMQTRLYRAPSLPRSLPCTSFTPLACKSSCTPDTHAALRTAGPSVASHHGWVIGCFRLKPTRAEAAHVQAQRPGDACIASKPHPLVHRHSLHTPVPPPSLSLLRANMDPPPAHHWPPLQPGPAAAAPLHPLPLPALPALRARQRRTPAQSQAKAAPCAQEGTGGV